MIRSITVLQDDIDNGVKRTPGKCAIALAARRELMDLALDQPGEVSVVLCRLYCGDYRAELPIQAQLFLGVRWQRKGPRDAFQVRSGPHPDRHGIDPLPYLFSVRRAPND